MTSPTAANARVVEPDVGAARTREPVQRGGEEQDHQHAQPELRHRVQHQRAVHRGLVELPAASPARVDAHRDPEDRGEDRGRAHEQDRRPHELDEQVEHLLVGPQDDRLSEVQPQRVVDVVEELAGEQRLVQAVVGSQFCLFRGIDLCALTAGEQAHRIRRQDPEQEEVEDDDGQQGEERLEDLLQDVAACPHPVSAVSFVWLPVRPYLRPNRDCARTSRRPRRGRWPAGSTPHTQAGMPLLPLAVPAPLPVTGLMLM